MTTRILSSVLFAALVASVSAADLIVDAAATAPGAFKTIQKAVESAKPGDTVLVKAGTYDGFAVQKPYVGAPLTVKAAPGERVVVSGMRKVEGWKDEGNGIYSAKVPTAADSLLVGYVEQQCARWPENGTRLPIRTIDVAKRVFRTDPVDDPRLAAIAKDPKDAVCFYFFAFGNCFGSPAVESYDAKTGDIRFSEKNWSRWIKPENNRYSFMNHPALIVRPGTWAFVSDAKGDAKNRAGTIYFKPKAKADLAKAQYRAAERPLVHIGHWKDRVANVVIDGLEITGTKDVAVRVAGDDAVVRNCIVHHNGGGIAARGVKNVKILSNVVIANGGTGIGLASIDTGLVEGNEIAFHQIDGIVVAGNISGRKTGTPGANPVTSRVTVRHNYHHHHFIQSHPDNIQLYRDVSDIVYEGNFNIWGGQSLMAEEAEDITVRDNVVMGCGAVMLICGHGNSHRWNFANNTLWGAGYGFFSFTGHDYDVSKCLLIGGGMPYDSPDKKVKSHDNRFVPAYSGGTARPWKRYTDLAKAQSELGQESGSKEGPADVGNMPAFYAVASANGDAVDSIRLRKDCEKLDFRAGDKVEFNGDGKLRTVKSCANGVLTFSPAFVDPPFRSVMIFNWKDAKSTLVDAKMVDGCGASISTVDFQKGDLLGKGTRSLPVLPPDVVEGLPDPNNLVIPPKGV